GTACSDTQAINEDVSVPKDILGDVAIVSDLSKELQQLQERLVHTQADFDNYRKRVAREQEQLQRQAASGVIDALLPILDNFELGLNSVQAEAGVLSGFQMIFTQLQSLLKARGVAILAPKNEPFNPQQEEAVAYVNHDEVPEEYVVETVRKGYCLHDRLLRPASVVVSKGRAS
ncbi:MAG: nucleotide exchange factor GrpE, partial [Opitutales bacterium]|nr:nucleotide exchange factor GrpE [Opitutales bacterium]